MGYIRHQAIIVTCWHSEKVESIHKMAVKLFGEQVSNIVKAKMNGYRSFFIGPDGSKEGWIESNEGDEKRDAFIEYLESLEQIGGWAEITYQDDSGFLEITRHG